MEIYKRQGIALPTPPPFCALSQRAVHLFWLICRERRYVDGTPLPLSVSDITAVVSVYDCPVPRCIFDDVVFGLDAMVRDEVQGQ